MEEVTAVELRQLEMLVAVADQGSITRAAQTLLVAQPSVSAQIQALESEVGHPLLVRLPRGVRPTAVGETVISHARRILREIGEIRSDVDELAGLRRGHLALGSMPTITTGLIPTVVKAFHTAFPGVEISVMEGRSSTLIEAVANHRIDLAVVTVITPDPPVEVTHLLDEELVVALAADDPLAGEEAIDLAQLADRPFLMLEAGFGLRDIVWDACRAAGFLPHVALEMESIQAIKALVEIGMGVSLVPRATTIQEERLGLLSAVRLRPPRPSRPVQIITSPRGHLTRAAQAFFELCLQRSGGSAARSAAAQTAATTRSPDGE
jgi:DNA-binding transcriptional LysR family regulator